MPGSNKNRTRTERAVAAGFRAIRRGVNDFARDVERSIIAGRDPRRIITAFDRNIAGIAFGRIAREAFAGRDAPVKVAAVEAILRATGGNRDLARKLIREKHEFGRTLAQDLNAAKTKMLRRMRNEVADGIRRKLTAREVASNVSKIWKDHHALNRVIAWHTARAANAAILARKQEAGEDQFITIKPSASHPKKDICDPHFGRHRRGYPIPPYHAYCTCIVE